MKLSTHLHYGGNCAEALRFYEEHLGAKILFSMTYEQMPEPKNHSAGIRTGHPPRQHEDSRHDDHGLRRSARQLSADAQRLSCSLG